MKVGVSAHKGRLRIRWRYRGKDYDLRPGLPETKQNRGYCEAIANKVLADCLTGEFDETLYKYRPWLIGHDHKVVSCPELFEKYTQAMQQEKGLYAGSLARYGGVLSHLRKRLNIDAHRVTESKAHDFASCLSEHVSNRTSKEYLWLIRTCFDWAQGRYSVPEVNPWQTVLGRVGSHVKGRIQPFTEDEMRLIIETFKGHKTYSYYADFTSLLFGVGCRPGEAIALQWKHLDPKVKTLWISQAYSSGKIKPTKTGRNRAVQLGLSMQSMFCDRKLQTKPKPGDLIFPSKSGEFINLHNYRERAWRSVLNDCGLTYRKVYTTRHTAISLALKAGVPPVEISAQTGHSLKTLLEHYAHVIERRPVFMEVG